MGDFAYESDVYQEIETTYKLLKEQNSNSSERKINQNFIPKLHLELKLSFSVSYESDAKSDKLSPLTWAELESDEDILGNEGLNRIAAFNTRRGNSFCNHFKVNRVL